jgi:2-phosphosulfolactate phosphatase
MDLHVYGGRAGACLAAAEGQVTVVVDALRSSATIASLLHHGVARVTVVETVEQAFAEAACQPGSMLVGERGCLRVEGFDLGNSPLRHPVANLRPAVVFTSSNMSRCCVAAADAPAVFLGSTVTASAVARLALREARARGRAIMLVPAGAADDENRFILEDYLACGAILTRLMRLAEGTARPADDAARAATDLYRTAESRGLEATFLATENGQFLCQHGFEADVRYASRVDVLAAVPRAVGTHTLPDQGLAVTLAAG